MSFSDEIKKITLNVFLILGIISVLFYIYKTINPYPNIGLEEGFLATSLISLAVLNVIFHIKEIIAYIDGLKSIQILSGISIPYLNKTQISYVIYFLLILAVSFVLIISSSKSLLQLKDLIPYSILIYLFLSLILKLDSRIPIAFSLFLLFLTATILVR